MLVLNPCYNVPMKQKFGTLALVTGALMVPVSILASALTEYYLKQGNSSNVDITAGLAYLRPILVVGGGVAAALGIATIVLAVIGFKKDESSRLAKLALVLLLVITLFSLSAGMLKKQTDKLEDAYTKKSLNSFFEDLSR